MKGIEFKVKIITWDRIELIKLFCLHTMIKNAYLEMDIVGCHISINLLVNHFSFFFIENFEVLSFSIYILVLLYLLCI